MIRELIKGSKTAFESLFRLYYPRLRKYAWLLLKDEEEANDLVQDVFYQIWQNRENLKVERQFSSFLYIILRNRCLNILKRKTIQDKYTANLAKLDSEELYHISFEDDSAFISLEERLTEELENTISQMPDRCREAFRLRWIQGKKIHEIAALMDISTSMVDKHLAKGLQIVRNRISPELFLLLLITKG